MTKKQKNIIIILAAIAMIGGIGTISYKVGSTRTIQAIEADTKAKEAVRKDIENYMSEEHTKEELKTKLLAELPKLDIQDRTSLIDAYIYGAHSIAANMMITDAESELLNKTIDEKNELHLDKIEDETLKSTIKAMDDNCVIIRYLNGQLFWDVDWDYFENTFGDLLREDYTSLLKFYQQEKATSYYDAETDTLKTDIVTGLLDKAYEMCNKYKESDLADAMKENYDFYKAVYFGAYYQSYIWTDTAEIKPELIESYKSYAETTKDPEMKTFIEDIVQQFGKLENSRTVPIMEKIKTFCNVSDETSSANSTNIDLANNIIAEGSEDENSTSTEESTTTSESSENASDASETTENVISETSSSSTESANTEANKTSKTETSTTNTKNTSR